MSSEIVNTMEKPKKMEEKTCVEIESSIPIRQDKEYKDTFNPIYRQMMDEGLV